METVCRQWGDSDAGRIYSRGSDPRRDDPEREAHAPAPGRDLFYDRLRERGGQHLADPPVGRGGNQPGHPGRAAAGMRAVHESVLPFPDRIECGNLLEDAVPLDTPRRSALLRGLAAAPADPAGQLAAAGWVCGDLHRAVRVAALVRGDAQGGKR